MEMMTRRLPGPPVLPPVSDEETGSHEPVAYEHNSGFWSLVTRVPFAESNLYLMFIYRKLMTRRHLRRWAGRPRGGRT